MALASFSPAMINTLRRLAKERQSRPRNRRQPMGVAYDTWDGPGMLLPGRKLPSLRGYVVVPKSTIPGAKRVVLPGGKQTLRLGKGQAYLWRRDQDTGTGIDLIPQVSEETGYQVEVTVYNLCDSAIVPSGASDEIDSTEPVLFVVQDIWGDLYIVEKCQLSSSSASFPSYGSSTSEAPSASGSEAPSFSASEGGSTSFVSGSGDNCQTETVVTDVTFDPVECKITVTKKDISFISCQGGSG